MEQQAISQQQVAEKSSSEKKPARKISADFYQMLAELTLQQKRQRALLRG